MNGKDGSQISKNNKKVDTSSQQVSEQVVSEGSMVVLNTSDLITDEDTSATKSIKNYSWKPITDISYFDNIDKYNSTLSFTAPYVKDNKPHTMKFELIVTDNDDKTSNSTYKANVIVKRVHRGIIFQGGVALGAYEAGAYEAIVKKIIEEDSNKKNNPNYETRPLFDIVAGTSIGAMNAAIIVSSVTQDGKILEDNKNWERFS